MWRAPVEFDFFAIDRKDEAAGLNSKEISSHSCIQRGNINDIQKAMSKIDPQLLKTMFSDGNIGGKPMSSKAKISTGGVIRSRVELISSLKIQLKMKQIEGRGTPLTIFYNGGIAKFNVCSDKAEKIIKVAEEFNKKGVSHVGSSSEEGELATEGDSFDLPLARRNSLMAFLDKRRERLTASSPYTLRRPNKATALKPKSFEWTLPSHRS